jgi:hypothetical protein
VAELIEMRNNVRAFELSDLLPALKGEALANCKRDAQDF